MKSLNKQVILLSALSIISFSSCKSNDSANDGKSTASDEKIALAEKYPEVPQEVLITGTDELSKEVFTALQAKYKSDLLALQKEVTGTGATFAIAFLSPEVGNSLTQSNKLGLSTIKGMCDESKIPFYDLTTTLATMDPLEITQMPKDGHWSKKGAEIVANELKTIVDANKSAKATIESTDGLFGDNTPGEDKIADGGKDMPYRIKINSQGLRMNKDVEATKTKQRILFMGDSEIFFPFLDNDFTGTELLQKIFSQKEILNAGMWGYTMDDYLSLFKDKAKKSASDVVVVVTNGNDILDYYFTNRNKLSRNPKATQPSPAEEKYYELIYGKK
jgi:hypothetical protein